MTGSTGHDKLYAAQGVTQYPAMPYSPTFQQHYTIGEFYQFERWHDFGKYLNLVKEM